MCSSTRSRQIVISSLLKEYLLLLQRSQDYVDFNKGT